MNILKKYGIPGDATTTIHVFRSTTKTSVQVPLAIPAMAEHRTVDKGLYAKPPSGPYFLSGDGGDGDPTEKSRDSIDNQGHK